LSFKSKLKISPEAQGGRQLSEINNIMQDMQKEFNKDIKVLKKLN
jgi:hypothetical protein